MYVCYIMYFLVPLFSGFCIMGGGCVKAVHGDAPARNGDHFGPSGFAGPSMASLGLPNCVFYRRKNAFVPSWSLPAPYRDGRIIPTINVFFNIGLVEASEHTHSLPNSQRFEPTLDLPDEPTVFDANTVSATQMRPGDLHCDCDAPTGPIPCSPTLPPCSPTIPDDDDEDSECNSPDSRPILRFSSRSPRRSTAAPLRRVRKVWRGGGQQAPEEFA